MLNHIKHIYTNNRFELILGVCILFILMYSIYRNWYGYSGTWSAKEDLIMNPYSLLYKADSRADVRADSRTSNKKESRGETECRRVLQIIFKRPFYNVRPDFLSNPVTGNRNLELDCYDPGLKLAVEYNGAQHYEYIPFFHKNKEAFYNQKYRDVMKRQMCKDNGVRLIEVPNTVKLQDIESFLRTELRKTGFM